MEIPLDRRKCLHIALVNLENIHPPMFAMQSLSAFSVTCSKVMHSANSILMRSLSAEEGATDGGSSSSSEVAMLLGALAVISLAEALAGAAVSELELIIDIKNAQIEWVHAT